MKKLMSLPSTRSIFARVTAFKRNRLVLGAVVVLGVLTTAVFVGQAATQGVSANPARRTPVNAEPILRAPSPNIFDALTSGNFFVLSPVATPAMMPAIDELYWDANGATAGTGGTGTWTTGGTWRLGSNVGALQSWADANNAHFQGTAGIVTINGGTTVSPLTSFFELTGFTLRTTNATLTTLAGSNSLSANVNLNFLSSADSADRQLAIGSVTGGAGSSFTFSGAQIAANNNARIFLNQASSSIDVPIIISGIGSTFAGFIASNTGTGITGTITNSSSFTTLLGATSGNDLTLSSSAVISGTAGLRIGVTNNTVNVGTVTLNAPNTYGGGTTFDGGTLVLGNNGALSTTTLTLGNSATSVLQAGGGARTLGNNIVWGGNGTLGGSNAFIFNGSLTSSGSNSRTMTVSNTGGTTLAGSVFLSESNVSARSLEINGTSAVTISGVVANNNVGNTLASPLTYSGSNTLTLSNTNTYTGTTFISGGGTISATTIGNSGASGGVGAGTTISLGSTTSSGTLLYLGTGETTSKIINLLGSTGGATIDQSGTGLLKFTGTNTATGLGIKSLTLRGSTAGTGEISGAIVNNSGTNTTSVVKAGTGSWTLSGANTYTGSTTINQGTLTAGSTTAIGPATSASLIFNGGSAAKFQLNGNNITVVELDDNVATGAIIESGSGTAGTDTLTVNATGSDSFKGVIQNGSTRTLALTVGSGLVLLGGVNTYTGPTTINATGTLGLMTTGSIANSTSINMAGGATFSTSLLAGQYTFDNSQTINGTGTTSSAEFQSINGISMGTTTPLTMTYASGNPTFRVASGAFILQSGNPVTVTTTSALPVGNYTLISAAGGAVQGTVPTSLTIAGAGIAAGTTASLVITGNQLVLQVVVPPDMTFNASGNLTAGNYNNVTINNCGTFVTMTGNVTIYGTLTINACAHLLTDTFFVSGPGSFVLNADGWLHIGSPNGITTSPTLSGNIQVTGGRSYSTAGNYVYTGTVNQAVGNGLPGTVANLLISNTGPSGNNTVTGNSGQIVTALLEMVAGVYSSASDYVDVQIDVGGTLSLAANITVSGNWTNNGTFNSNGFSVTFDGTGPQLITTGGAGATKDFDGFIVNKASDTATLAGDLKSASLDITAGGFDQGATFGVDTGATTVGGSGVWTNTGTGDFNHTGSVTNAGSITFNGSGAACGQADAISIGSPSQTAWTGAGTFSMTDVLVSNQGGTAPIIVRSGTDSGGNGLNWVFVAACTGNTYTWNNLVNGDWNVGANWTPTRGTKDASDVLIFGSGTPTPTVTNVAGALGGTNETIAELHINGSSPKFSAAAGGNTLTINSGASVTGFDVDALEIEGANALRIELGTGTLGVLSGTMVVGGGGHRLISNDANAITMLSTATFTTTSSFTGNPFGTGGGEGAAGSVQFLTGAFYVHGGGLSPFGTAGNASVCAFQTGSTADWETSSGFQANNRTYANLLIGNGTTPISVTDNTNAGNFQFDNLTVNSTGAANSTLTVGDTGGASTITIRGNITSTGTGSGTVVSDVSLTAGSGNILLTNANTHTFSNTGNSRTITFGSNATLNSGATLTLSRNLVVSPSSSVFTITSGATFNAGSGGYVIGNLRKTPPMGSTTFEVGTANGYSPVTINVTTLNGTPTFTVSATNSYMTGITDTNQAIQRFWTLSTTAPANDLIADLTFQYVPGAPPTGDESGGVNRSLLNVFRRNGQGTINEIPATSRVTTTSPPPSVTVNGMNAFSEWTLANGGSVLTHARLRSFEALNTRGGNVVRWQTSYEVDNLGFNLYRMEGKQLVRVTPSLVAGSALLAGPRTAMTAGMSYSWRDPKGAPGSEYYLEDVDLNGARTMNGPIVPVPAENTNLSFENQARLLSELNESQASSPDAVTGRPAGMSAASVISAGKNMGTTADRMTIVRNDPTGQQSALAGGHAVKIAIRQTGWYRVTREELTTAGLDAATDQRMLQLYADGTEQSILTNDDGSIEFYGRGMDTATSDTRTYWLVVGAQAGKRIRGVGQANSNSQTGAAQKGGMESNEIPEELPLQSYAYTVERKDRTIYFTALLNGEADNFFGAIVTGTPAQQTLGLSNIHPTGAGQATLEVALQGASLKPHQVRVSVNGTQVGLMEFTGREHAVKQFQLPRLLLKEGNNTITLQALGTDSDVSVVDYTRVTYYRTYRAENDGLVFTSDHKKPVWVDGFSTSKVRVFDITDANTVEQVGIKVMANGTGGASYGAKIPGGKGTSRTLLAISDGQMLHPAGVGANETSDLTSTDNRADFVIVTHRDFREAIAPLADLRRSQGLEVMVVNIEDVYDEFSYGAPSRQAVKDFFAYATSKWANGPAYALLVGDASFDSRNYLKTTRRDYVPTKLVDTNVLETASDDALVDFNNDSIADISIGRLPVQTLDQARKMIGKITGYVPGQSGVGVLLVADHYEGYDFEMANDRVRALLPLGTPVATVNRGERATEQVRGEIIAGINQGPMIVNYAGHGSVEVWTGSGILRSADTPSLTNGQKAPFFVSMTCLNGFFQDVYTESLAEALMKADQGGAVAVWASSGLTEPSGQSLMDQQLMRLLFANGQAPMLGDAVRGAKAATVDPDVRRTWILFGDPTMRLRP